MLFATAIGPWLKRPLGFFNSMVKVVGSPALVLHLTVVVEFPLTVPLGAVHVRAVASAGRARSAAKVRMV